MVLGGGLGRPFRAWDLLGLVPGALTWAGLGRPVGASEGVTGPTV